MLLILLKSAACLSIFMAFYKLFLERENMHQFKRFYLLAALVVSFAIPFITFIKYVEPTFDLPYFNADHSESLNPLPIGKAIVEESINYLPTILWSVYGLGVLLFGIKFGFNLYRIISRINKNEKQKQGHFITVLLKDLIAPHTFFSYIFLNKTKFETKAIPEEVLLHEVSHAKQKHSLDVLFIELLQVVFWFNPLLYFIKKDIKLNHEFLADEAVLKHGIDSSTYQNTLLAFSSNAAEPELANAINYSLIKKRFTIMKTQTSKRAIWLRSLVLLPLLGGLLFSFSSTKEIEKEVVPAMLFPEETQNIDALTNAKEELAKNNYTARSISIKVFKNGTYKVDGIKANKKTFKEVINQLHQDITPEVRNNIINIHVNSPKDISDKEVWFIYNSVLDYGFHRIVANNQEVIRAKGNKPFALESNEYSETKTLKHSLKESVNNVSNVTYTDAQDGATPKQIAAYNALANKYNTMSKENMFVQQKDVERLKYLYEKMTVAQRKNAEPFPVFPPLPPPPAPVKEYHKMKAKATTKLPPPPPPPAKPKSPAKHAKEMANKGAVFFYNGDSISSKKAIELLENNEKVNISTHTNNGKSTVHLSTKPITVINGRAIIDENSTQIIEDRKEAMKKRRKVLLEDRDNAMEDRKRAMDERESKMHDLHRNRKPLAEQFKGMEKQGGEFFYEGDKISESKAIELIKENPKLNVSMQSLNGKSTVHLSKKGIKVVNGKLIKRKK